MFTNLRYEYEFCTFLSRMKKVTTFVQISKLYGFIFGFFFAWILQQTFGKSVL